MGTHKYALLDEGSTFKRVMTRLLLVALTICILIVIVIPIYINYAYNQDINTKIDRTYASYAVTPPETIGNQPGNFTDADGHLQTEAEAMFSIVISSIDPIIGTAKVSVDVMNPLVQGENIPNYFNMPTNVNYTLFLNGEIRKGNHSLLVPEWTFPINLIGDPSRYPFDEYQSSLTFAFHPEETLIHGINTQVIAYAAQTGWKVRFHIQYNIKEGGIFVLTPMVVRNTATKGFSLFVVFLSWILSICQFFIAAQTVLRNRPVVPPLLAVLAATLYALPSLRNVQPGIPPIGIVLDIAGFYWNMAMVAISLISISILYIFQFEL